MSTLLAGAVIGLHLFTAHSPSGLGLTGVNPGAYVRTADGWTAGAYRNSFGRPSLYAGRTFETEDKRFALTVGGITGYDRQYGAAYCPAGLHHTEAKPCYRGSSSFPVAPLLVPSVRFDLGAFDARLSYMPKVEKRAAHALHLSVEWSL